MQETIICLCNLVTAIHADTCYFQCSPNRITGEQLVVGLDSCKFYHTEFHCHMVDEFLCFFLCQNAVFQISLNVNIKEGRYTSNTHGCTILCLNSCKVSEVYPLNCLFRIFSRL